MLMQNSGCVFFIGTEESPILEFVEGHVETGAERPSSSELETCEHPDVSQEI